MKNNITTLEINNFKSIKNIKMDCKRINVLIGKPNVGKSNILEALSLYIAPNSDTSKKLLEDYIRYEKLSNLFYDQDRKNEISINSNIGFVSMRYEMNSINQYVIILGPKIHVLDELRNHPLSNLNDEKQYFEQLTSASDTSIPSNYHITKPFYSHLYDNHSNLSQNHEFIGMFSNRYETPIKKYHFSSNSKHGNHFSSFLRPPDGDNLFTILESNPKLFEECSNFFNEYGLDLLVDTVIEKLDVQKKVGKRVYKIPYSLAADTLQRIIFHLAAIETNNDSILLFEEPENHSFPPYVSMLADKMIECKENQFFVATHSPYILTQFIEQCPPEDINIFIASYKNYETVIRALTEEEIKNIIETDIDFFFNSSAFLV